MDKQPIVMIRIEGGVVQGIFADQPVRAFIIDYDIDGSTPEELTAIPQDEGWTEDACAWEAKVDVMPETVAELVTVIGG
jgi:hypothetical protein